MIGEKFKEILKNYNELIFFNINIINEESGRKENEQDVNDEIWLGSFKDQPKKIMKKK